MKLPIVIGIAIGWLLYELGFVIPWLCSNTMLPVQIDIFLFIINAIAIYYVIYKMVNFFCKKNKKTE